jgi:hypothetical protein
MAISEPMLCEDFVMVMASGAETFASAPLRRTKRRCSSCRRFRLPALRSMACHPPGPARGASARETKNEVRGENFAQL